MKLARHPVKVTCVHPGGIKTKIARNAGAVEGADAARLPRSSTSGWPKPRPTPPRRRSCGRCVGNSARALVGPDAKVLDVLIRLLGSKYQRLVALGAKKSGAVHADTPSERRANHLPARCPPDASATTAGPSRRVGPMYRRRVCTTRTPVSDRWRRISMSAVLAMRVPAGTVVRHVTIGGRHAELITVGRHGTSHARCCTCTAVATGRTARLYRARAGAPGQAGRRRGVQRWTTAWPPRTSYPAALDDAVAGVHRPGHRVQGYEPRRSRSRAIRPAAVLRLLPARRADRQRARPRRARTAVAVDRPGRMRNRRGSATS